MCFGKFALSAISGRYYKAVMNQIASVFPRIAVVAVVAAGLSMAAALAFAGWLQHGAAIFLALSENGFSLCF